MTALWQQRLALVLESLGITQTQYAILASLKWFEENKEPTTQTHLGEHAHIEKMTLSKAIRQLEKKGLLSRKKSKSDSRAVLVQFSERGQTLIKKAIVAIENADDEFFMELNEKQLENFKSLVKTVITANSSES